MTQTLNVFLTIIAGLAFVLGGLSTLLTIYYKADHEVRLKEDAAYRLKWALHLRSEGKPHNPNIALRLIITIVGAAWLVASILT